jgi:HK97 family phage major capsid protein
MGYSDLVSTADALALMPTEQRMEIIKATFDKSASMQLCRKLRNMNTKTTTMKVTEALAVGGFVNGPSVGVDAPLIETTTASWEDVLMTAESYVAIVVIDRDTIDDTQVDLFAEIKEQVSDDISAKFDAATLAGTGAPTSWPTGGILTHAVSAGNTVTLGAGADLYDDLLSENGVWSLVEADGFKINGAVGAVTVSSRLRGLRDSNGNPILNTVPADGIQDRLNGVPFILPDHGGYPSGSAHIIVGDFKNAVWAMRKELEIEPQTQGVIQDAAGNITHNLNQQRKVALRFSMRLGFALPNPVNKLQPTAASRSPFGVLHV